MNKVILMGRLTKAPEIKDLQDDNKTAMARYTLASIGSAERLSYIGIRGYRCGGQKYFVCRKS